MWLLVEKIDFGDFENLAEKKLMAVNDSFDINSVFTDLGIVRSLWKNDLIQLIPELPDFDAVIMELREKLNNNKI